MRATAAAPALVGSLFIQENAETSEDRSAGVQEGNFVSALEVIFAELQFDLADYDL